MSGRRPVALAWGRRALQRSVRSTALICAACTLMGTSADAAPTAPTIGSASVHGVGPTVATIQAQIVPNGAYTIYRFEYGPTTSYGNFAPAGGADIGGSETVSVAQTLQGLTPDSVYHCRILATNAQGTSVSEDETFSTFGIASFATSIVNADGTPDAQAGSHPYEVTSTLELPINKDTAGKVTPAGELRDIGIDLPPGLIGDPQAVQRCPTSRLEGAFGGPSGCPLDTQIGLLSLSTVAGNFTVPLYNLVPANGKPAEFGVWLLLLPAVLDASVRQGDYGLHISLDQLSQALPIIGASLTLWGVPADPGHDPYRGSCMSFNGVSTGTCPSGAQPLPFITLPTACPGSLTFGLQADSWEQPNAFATASSRPQGSGGLLQMTGCERLQFHPSIQVQTDGSSADSPMGLNIDMNVPHAETDSLATPDVKSVELTLPPGISIDPSAGDGLSACSIAQVALLEPIEPLCPESSKIGSAEVDTPLLPKPMTGSVYLAQPSENPFGSMLAAYVTVAGEGVSVKVPLQLQASSVTGQLQVLLGDMPQLPFSRFSLSLHGGPRAPLASPDACGTFAATAALTPYSAFEGVPPAMSSSELRIDGGCQGDFAPSLVAGMTNLAARSYTGFVFELNRGDGQQHLQTLSLTLPKGLLANLSSVSPCASSDATSGTCPSASRIGGVTIAAGAGSHPFYLSGQLFFTGAYRSAPFGISIVLPVHVGPLDLGTIVVRGQVSLSSRDLRLTIVPDPLPQILDGIPLRLRTLDLIVDRPGFLSNPTNCARHAIQVVLGSAEGANVSLSTAVSPNGCRSLALSLRVHASVQLQRTHRDTNAGVQLKMSEGGSSEQTNIQRLAISLRGALRPRLATIQQACRIATFQSDPAACPPVSRVGRASMTTPVIPGALTGPVYLVFRGGRSAPELITVLQGQGLSVDLDGVVEIAKNGVMSTTFTDLPDAPIKAFSLSLPPGAGSLLGALRGLCGTSPTISYAFTGQNGLRTHGARRMPVEGCTRRR